MTVPNFRVLYGDDGTVDVEGTLKRLVERDLRYALYHLGSMNILELNANMINVTDSHALASDDGYTQMKSDGVRVYDETDNLVTHLGRFETLADQTATFTRASTAYKQDGSSVASGVPRYETGKFNQAVTVEEGTTNLLVNPGFESGDTGWTKSSAAIENVAGWEGSWRGRMNLNGSEPDHGRLYQTVAVTAEQSYTVSAYVKRLSGGQPSTFLFIIWKNSGGGIISQSTSPDLAPSITGDWGRFSLTATAPTGAVNALVYCYVVKGTAVDCVWDAVQFENKAYATSFHPTTRAAETLTVPTAGVLSVAAGTWEQMVYVNDVARRQVAGQYPTPFHIPRADGGTGIWVYHNSNTAEWHLQTRNDANAVTSGSCADSLTPDGWHRFSVVWKSGEAALLIDGVRRITITNPNMPTGFAANAFIGAYSTTLHFLNTLLDDLRISSRARTDAEILADYESGAALTVDADTTYKMSFDDTLKPTVRQYGLIIYDGEIYSTKFRSGTPGATHTYIELTPEGNLVFVGATSTKTLEMRAGWGQGDIRWYDQYENLAGSILIKVPTDQAFWIKSNRSDTDIYLDSAKNILLKAVGKIIAKKDLVPDNDNIHDLGGSGLRWDVAYVRYLSQGDACFAERECIICGEPFTAGDSVILLANTIHPVLGTMTIPIHERCKDTQAIIEWEVPEVEESYGLNDLGEPEKRMIMVERDVTQPVVQIRSGYELDRQTGQFRREDGTPATAAEATEATLVKFRKKKMRKVKVRFN